MNEQQTKHQYRDYEILIGVVTLNNGYEVSTVKINPVAPEAVEQHRR
jgi:hypothetical protein